MIKHAIHAHHRLDELTHGHAKLVIAIAVLIVLALAFIPRKTAAAENEHQVQMLQSYAHRVQTADYITARLHSSLQGQPYAVRQNCLQSTCTITIERK